MKPIVFGLAMTGLTITGCSQDIAANKVPSVVTNAFQASFPGASQVDWEKKKEIYEAEFTQGSLEVTVELDPSGKLNRQKQDMIPAQLPSAIMQAINNQFKEYTIEDVEKLIVNNTTLFQVELDVKGTTKDQKLVFDSNGSASNTPYWD